MAPEQARGEAVDARADLFSFGCVLYRLATGREPFRAADAVSALHAVTTQEPTPPRQLNAEMPPALADLIVRLLSKSPAARPASARAVVEALSAIEKERASPAVARPQPRRSRRLLVAVAAGLLLVLGGAWLVPQIVLRITGKDGTVREVPLDPGDKIEVVQKQPTEEGKPALADKELPFLLRHAGAAKPEAFKHLTSTLFALRDGDVIEVHGNGPFPVVPVTLKEKGLTLRAAPGYRPRFVPAPGAKAGAWFGITDAALRVEGCDFVGFPATLFGGNGPAWEVRNCCHYGHRTADYTGPGLKLADTLIYSSEHSPIALGAKSGLEMTNCVVRSIIHTTYPLIQLGDGGGQSIRLHGNTLLASPFAIFGTFNREMKTVPPITVEATGNYLEGSLWYTGHVDPGDPTWKDKVRWRGRKNLYVPAGGHLVHGDKPVRGLEAWKQLLGGGAAEDGSREAKAAPPRYLAPVLGPTDEAMRIIRAEVESLRKRLGAKFADLGPDFDRLGPGAAYVKALAADGKAVPREGSRVEAPLGDPFVLFRAGKVVRACLILPEAMGAASQGDAGPTHHGFSELPPSRRISSRNSVSAAAASRLQAMLILAGCCLSRLRAIRRSTAKSSAPRRC
jgi:hypothetical protein